MQPRPLSPAVARFMARTAHEFTPRPAQLLNDEQLNRCADRSITKMLLAMIIVMLFALAYAKLESKAAPGAAQLTIGPSYTRWGWHWDNENE